MAIESLPAILGVDADALFDKPYVHVSGKKFGKLFVQKSRPRIGICIQGNPLNGRDHFRSISLAEFSCLLDNDDFEFYFLHKNLNNICNLGKLEEVEHILDCGRYITNIMDTAELIGHMDLVISIDSLTAHLAGAMGREVWVMVCANPHWIYEVDSTCCPWYPSMDIFRQNKLGSWKPVLETVHSRLLERFH